MEGHGGVSSYLLIDVNVTVGNRGAYATKHFLESEDEYFVDMVDAVLTKYARAIQPDVIISNDADKDPINVEVQAMLARIK